MVEVNMTDFFSKYNCKIKKMEKPDFISLYRDHLMGIAILWIVFLHSEMSFGRFGFVSEVLSFIKDIGYIGVDILFFVSGFGLTIGWYRKKDTGISFYKRRFLRIMPTYWFFLSIYLIMMSLYGKTANLSNTSIYYTGLGFFVRRDEVGHWFVSAILLCYLIFPFFMHLFEKNKDKLRLVILIVTSCLLLAMSINLSTFLYTDMFSFLLIVILRLPAFFIGSLIGYIFLKKNNNFTYLFSIYFHIILTSFCFVTIGLICYLFSIDARWLYGLWWYPFVFGTFSFTFLLSILFEVLHKSLNPLFTLLEKMGRSSFELYFIHVLIFKFTNSLIFRYSLDIQEADFLRIFTIIISVFLSIIFHSIYAYLF